MIRRREYEESIWTFQHAKSHLKYQMTFYLERRQRKFVERTSHSECFRGAGLILKKTRQVNLKAAQWISNQQIDFLESRCYARRI